VINDPILRSELTQEPLRRDIVALMSSYGVFHSGRGHRKKWPCFLLLHINE
jgi:hypothetical protein